MANGDENDTSVTLELQIKDTVVEQVTDLAEKAGNEAEKQIKKTAGNATSIIDKQTQKINSIVDKNIYAEWGKIDKTISNLSNKKIESPKIKIPDIKPKSFELANNSLDLAKQKLANIGTQMGELAGKLETTEEQYRKISESKGFDSDDAVKLRSELTALESKLISLQSTALGTEEKLNKALTTPADKAKKAYEKSYNDIIKRAEQSSQKAVQWAVRAEKARSRSASRSARRAEKAFNKQTKACQRYANKYADAQADASDKAVASMNKAYSKMERLSAKALKKAQKASVKMAESSSKGTSKIGKGFSKLGKTIKRSFKAVFVTAVLYKFFKTFKEHINGAMAQNKAFAKSLNEIKANLSVAFTPIIEAVMPMITRLAQGLATVTKYIASFVAAIFGKTYKQAVNSTKKIQGQAQKAKASSSRDFDELHNVESEENSSSAGGTDYSALDTSQLNTGPMQIFQEILDKIHNTLEKITPSFKEFYNNGIKPVTEWVGGKMKEAFSLLGRQFDKVGNWLAENKDRFVELGDALGRLWKFLEPVLNAAWDVLSVAVDGLFDGLLDSFDSILDIAPDVIDFVIALFRGDWTELKEIGGNILEGLWDGIKTYWENMKQGFSDLWQGAVNIVKAIFGVHSPSTVFSDIGHNLIQGLIDGVTGLWDTFITTVTEKIESFKSSVTEKFTRVKDSILGKLREIRDGAKEIFSNIWNGTKNFINKMLGGVENMINKPVRALNKFIDKLNALKVDIPDVLGGGTIGFNVNRFESVSIPKLARGGIVNKPTLSLIGEAGKEAVVPLQNNTEWMEKLVAMFGNTLAAVLAPLLIQRTPQTESGPQKAETPINLDGQRVATIIYDILKKYPNLG